jgi:ribosomal-protein-alanine N-acetyltransferase
MMGSLHIKVLPMTHDDVPEILTIADDDLDRWSGAAIREELDLPGRFCFTAWEPPKRKIIGFIIGRIVAGEAEIFKFVVRFSYKRRGVGSRILNHALGYLQSKNTNRCFLELRQSNVPARNLYEKAGFKLYSSRKKYYSDPCEDARLMEKSLQPTEQTENIHSTGKEVK